MTQRTERIPEGRFLFHCSGCDEAFVVDEGVRDDLLSAGCYLCGTPVDESHFRRAGDE